MYFASRTAAGQKLADELEKYRYEDCAVLALSDGGVVVGAQIAAKLHCPLMFLLMRDIVLPGEKSAVGVVDQNGGFTYDDMFSAGELEAIKGDFHTYIESEKLAKWRELNRLLTDGGLVNAEILKGRNIIVVSDGLFSGTSLLATNNFLKPIKTKRTVLCTPIATIEAVDKMHILGDELHVLSVVEDTFELDHYYENDDVPEQSEIIKIINEAILRWK